MKINSIKSINFGRTFYGIDMHAHDKSVDGINQYPNADDITKFVNKSMQIGEDEFVLKKAIPSALSGIMYKDENGIRKPYVNEWNANKGIIETYKGTVIDKFYAVCQPKETNGNPATIMKLLSEDSDKHFVGLKFHPEFSQLEANSSLYDAYLNLAKEKGLPCLFHSDRSFDTDYPYIKDGENLVSTVKKSNYSRPEQIYELAKRHPDVPIIMGHMGGPEANDTKAAVDIIIDSADKNNSKLYADFSWVDADNAEKPNLIEVIKRLKNREQGSLLDRIMFGSDMPIDRFKGEQAENNYKKLISDIHTAVKKGFGEEADEILEKIFLKNSEKLFGENLLFGTSDGGVTIIEPPEPNSLPKLIKYAIAGAVILGAAFAVMKYFQQQENKKTTILNNSK